MQNYATQLAGFDSDDRAYLANVYASFHQILQPAVATALLTSSPATLAEAQAATAGVATDTDVLSQIGAPSKAIYTIMAPKIITEITATFWDYTTAPAISATDTVTNTVVPTT